LPTSLHLHLVRCITDGFRDLLLGHTQIEQSTLAPQFTVWADEAVATTNSTATIK